MSEPLLSVSGLTKHYSGQLAVDDVDFDVGAGEIHAVVGENGAGKSTLAKIISGATKPDAGVLCLEGAEVSFDEPRDAVDAGIGMVYQENSLVDSLTVTHNLFLMDSGLLNNLHDLHIKARILLASQNFHIEPTSPVSALGAAQKQMVEIARVVARSARVIIFDEPTASITPEESRQLFLSMNSLKQNGAGIIFITHNLEEALTHADRISVMRDGVLRATEPAAEMTREKIVRLMVGRDVALGRKPRTFEAGVEPALELDNVTLPPVVQNMSFSVYPGQIVALAGIVGAGRSEAAMIAAGALKRRRVGGGQIRVDGRTVRFRTPRAAIRAGLVYITEDRKAKGIFTNLTIADNIAAGRLGTQRLIQPVIRPRPMSRLVADLVEKFSIRTLRPEKALLVELSGGNQQKTMLAKSLTRTPKIVIFDEPTRGVDVGSIQDIHTAIREIADQGAAVVVISSYLPEVMALGDRVLVARSGRVVAEFEGESVTEEQIMFAAVH
ncbi:sugar ABC transporter ATP-binding protein [Georgenia sp. SYP-B2076]|uniref:sugar ABC transporter ATP-binding protein n=1 Tax=Georgenia sp. SYP-B2076 TaxID=2495881 RepID=UPI000F8E85AF|nr:sugar ABC transporter ATP-binding protein [Georgenia sp. SYP-B2076]